MKLNYDICLVGKRVILVPYRKFLRGIPSGKAKNSFSLFCFSPPTFFVGPEHVPTYHEWMKDPDLLEATGSEPLSYDDEIDMQKSWKNDETKCTFIVHAADACRYSLEKFETVSDIEGSCSTKFDIEENLEAMVGDVNLFLSEIDDSDESDTDNIRDVKTSQETTRSEPKMQAEVDIMIARKDFQGKGLGRAATCAMLLYGVTKLGIHRFFCRINEDNTNSIRLFKAIGFEQCNYAACFKQVELDLCKTLPEMEEIFKEHGGSFSIVPCEKENKI